MPLSIPQLVLIALVVALASCSSDPEEIPEEARFNDGGDVDVPFDAVEEEGCARLHSAVLVRERSVPGGRQLHVRLGGAHGQPLEGTFASCLRITEEEAGEAPSVWTEVSAGPGATLIVARWNAASAEINRAWIDAFVAARPADEVIAVWAWSDTLYQVVPASTHRALLSSRLDAVWSVDAREPTLVGSASALAVEGWEEIHEDTLRGARSIVFLAPDLELSEIPPVASEAVSTHWVVSENETGRRAPRVYAMGDDPEASAQEFSEHLDDVQAAGLGLLAWCDNGAPLELTALVSNEVLFETSLNDAAVENQEQSCDLQAALDDRVPQPVVMDITFSALERRIYDGLHASGDDSDFSATLQLDFWPAGAPIAAHFRGQSSLSCERKSLSVNVRGRDPRDFVPDSGTDEFYLLSMCQDDDYIGQMNGSELMRLIDAWYVESAPLELLTNHFGLPAHKSTDL